VKKRSVTIGLVAICVGGFAWVAQSRSSAKPSIAAAPARSAATARARPATLTSAVTLAGEFKPFQEVDVHAKVAGYIKTISVDVGDRVRAGRVLAVLEVPELEAQVEGAKASLERARSAHEAAHYAYTRLKQASETRPGLIAAQELDDAYGRDRETEAQVAASQAAQRQVTVLAEYARITAPFDGVVTRRYADTGSLIQAGTSSSTQALPVVRLAEDDRLRLVVPVPESAVPQIHLGTEVDVRVPALGRSFRGKVSRFADDLDRQTRTMSTEIDVPNPDSRLVAGMYAETTLDLSKTDEALTVPVQAVARNGNEASVLRVGPGNRLEEQSVKLGADDSRSVQILSGLHEGDLVVIGSRSEFRPGEIVEPRPFDEPGKVAKEGR